MARRENGMGSVYKRSDLKYRPWIAVGPTTYELTPEGKLRTIRPVIGHYARSKEAHEALEEFKKHPTTKWNITLAELYDEWSGVAFRNITKATINNWKAAWLKLAQLHDKTFREIRTGQMQAIIDYYAAPRKEIQKGKETEVPALSLSSLQKIKALLTQLYDYAIENDIALKNYASFLVLPKQQKKKKDAFTDVELEKIRRSVGVVPWADCIYLMCYTGWRISEFLELTPFDYDPVNKTLTGGKKTEAGRDRIVPVHPKVQGILDSWLAKRGQTIICKNDGSSWPAETWRKQCWYPALEQMGLRRLTPHSTRHTFATICAAAGLRPEDMQALLGHESYEVTASTYIHQSTETLRKAVNALK